METQCGIVWLDLETGGFSAKHDQIIQVGAIYVTSDLVPIREIEIKLQLIEGRYRQKALDVNSYNPDDWQDAVTEGEALELFDPWLRKCAADFPDRRAILAGHNLAFDIRFLQAWYGGRQIPALTKYGSYVDTMPLARAVEKKRWKKFNNRQLVTLCKAFGISHNAHDAMGDVRANISLFQEFERILSE